MCGGGFVSKIFLTELQTKHCPRLAHNASVLRFAKCFGISPKRMMGDSPAGLDTTQSAEPMEGKPEGISLHRFAALRWLLFAACVKGAVIFSLFFREGKRKI